MKTTSWLLALFSPLAFGQALPAFYGAEGGGALSVGGRGGTVCVVESLANSGTGTLRECINTHNSTSGSRMTVVFRVGGTIQLQSRLIMNRPYITIAGQTAPGGGIQLSGKQIPAGVYEMIRVNTHDVIIRYLKVRAGSIDPYNSNLTLITITGQGHTAIIDHSSLFWARNKVFSAWGLVNQIPPRNITFSYNIAAETFEGHSVNILTGAHHYTDAEAMTDIDFHNNLSANASHRHPLLKNRSTRFINNIVYNWRLYASQAGTGIDIDFIGNLYKHGPLSKNPNFLSELGVFLYHPTECGSDQRSRRDPSVYVAGNKGPWFTTPDADNWPMVSRVRCENGGYADLPTLSTAYRRASPLPPVGAPITVRHVNDLENHLLPIVGASRRLDCMGNWVYNRDAQDVRLIDDYQNNRGAIINSETEVGGFPTIAEGTPCQDTDGDGMPDEWEIANGLNPNNDADRNTVHASGYTMLEMYLNGPMEGQVLTLAPPTNIRFTQ